MNELLKNAQTIQIINAHLQLLQVNEIPVLAIEHPKVSARVTLQGAHLISWQPHHASRDVLWLSEIEPFEAGGAIRGGVPICYPWFGGVGSPSHGYARTALWQLSDWNVEESGVSLTLTLSDDNGIVEASLALWLGETCQMTFTHYGSGEAQAALHSYFNVADIRHTALYGLPKECLNSLTGEVEAVPSPRHFDRETDCIYHIDSCQNCIEDSAGKREIVVEHYNNSDVVVWNPWENTSSNMSEIGFHTMLCVETARIQRLLAQNEQLRVTFTVSSAQE